MIYLREYAINAEGDAYPFRIKALEGHTGRRFSSSVTFFAGDNGAGKSTLLEAIARRIGMPALGQFDTDKDVTLKSVDPLSDRMKLVWNRKPRQSFFLRSEDFFGFVKRLAVMRSELLQDLANIHHEYEGREKFAKDLASMPFVSSLFEMEHRYGIDPDAQSHGESFLSIFDTRMRPGGLYLMDEPESALSPTRQMSLLRLIHERQAQCQFIIATHSPILLALPGAEIWSFDHAPLKQVSWDELSQVETLRGFLNAPERYLRHLLSED